MNKTLGMLITLTVIVMTVRVMKDIEDLKFKTSSNLGKLSTKPGLSEIDRLDLRIDHLLEKK